MDKGKAQIHTLFSHPQIYYEDGTYIVMPSGEKYYFVVFKEPTIPEPKLWRDQKEEE